MHTLSRLLDRLESAMRALACCCLMGMALLTGADVAGRGLLDTPLFGSEELTAILATLAVALCLPYAHAQGVHIGVEVLISRLPRRVRRRVALATGATAMLLFAVVAWRMVDYALTLRASGQLSMNLGLPTYPVVLALAFGFAMFTLFLARDVLRLLTAKDGR
ncbi:TRAP transporter small permease [Desulfocurvus sp.]|jgi:TRAP-type C4-dicarboxylate transport system permease small subunit|uniref:TRAP transporter small permease n=1 Tax=Desulfocurvus sp. TaxID=2871698 RepID=UPI0025BA8B80|nr:TRAP transporter small permease [Desulfocurvus sp.]MCK9241289.1 TRAP transporter small permease [Desulfocurvus sp.]